MEMNARRNFFGKIAAMSALVAGTLKVFGQQQAPAGGVPAPNSAPGGDAARRPGGNHTHDGIYYFSGTGSNDGYPKEEGYVLAFIVSGAGLVVAALVALLLDPIEVSFMLSGPHPLTRSNSSATHCVIEPMVALMLRAGYAEADTMGDVNSDLRYGAADKEVARGRGGDQQQVDQSPLGVKEEIRHANEHHAGQPKAATTARFM